MKKETGATRRKDRETARPGSTTRRRNGDHRDQTARAEHQRDQLARPDGETRRSNGMDVWGRDDRTGWTCGDETIDRRDETREADLVSGSSPPHAIPWRPLGVNMLKKNTFSGYRIQGLVVRNELVLQTRIRFTHCLLQL
ncbi:hypothetical protein Sjap_002030 [Stephania japonica]|uniref:Uncharacterized protein n=1 Tax=Stephania japonica TaxID=461633 RepID=A0AAP0KM00_9MAGN